MNLRTRFKLLWLVLRGIRRGGFMIEDWHVVSDLRTDIQCGCDKHRHGECASNGAMATVCLSRTMLEVSVEEQDHLHVCSECAKRLLH